MVETRFDRGVYEDDDEESNSSSDNDDRGGGGGGGSDEPELTENEKEADIVIRDGEIIAADEDARFESDTPTQIIDNDDSGSSGGSSGSNTSSGSSSSNKDQSTPGNQPNILKEIITGNAVAQKDPENLTSDDIDRLQERNQELGRFTSGYEQNTQVLDQIDRGFEARERLDQNIDTVQSSPDDTRFKVNEEELDKSAAMDLLERREQQVEKQLEQSKSNIDRLKKSRKEKQQSSFSKARENTGVDPVIQVENPLDPQNDFRDTVTINRRGIDDTITNPEEQSIITGVEIADEGQRFADDVIDRATALKQDFDRSFIEATPGLTYNPNSQQRLRQGVTPETVIEKTGRGTATVASQAIGLGIATPGAVSKSFEKDTPSLGEGAVEGGRLVKKEAENDPVGLVAGEVGEEIGEKAVFASAGGLAGRSRRGVAGFIPTPDFRSVGDSSPSTFDRAVTAALPGNNVLIADTDTGSTPDFVNDFDTVDTVEPDIDSRTPDFDTPNSQNNILADTQPAAEPEADPLINDLSSPIVDPVAETSPVSTGFDDFLSEFQSEPVTQVESRFEPRTDPISEVATFDPLIETRPRTEVRPEPSFNTPSPGFGDDSFDPLEGFDEETEIRKRDEGEFAESVTAQFFNVRADQDFDEEEFTGTGLEIRPLL